MYGIIRKKSCRRTDPPFLNRFKKHLNLLSFDLTRYSENKKIPPLLDNINIEGCLVLESIRVEILKNILILN